MQKLQDSVFSIVKTTSLSPAVFSFLQPSEENSDTTPLGRILNDSRHAWLALGPKFCVIDLKTGLKIAARTFGTPYGHPQISVSCVVELPTTLTNNTQQLIISLQCDDGTGMICVFHINGSQILRCIQTEVIVTELAVSDGIPDGLFTCFDGVIMAGTKNGEIFVFDLNRASLIQALKDITQGYEHLIQGETNPANLTFLPLNTVHRIEEQRDLAVENDHHIAVLINEDSLVDGQYLFRNPDGTICMKAKRDQIRVTVLQYIPQLASLAVGYNFGAFQIWNMISMELEFTSPVNVECLPVTHFGFQEPCDDPRAFCYLWVVFSLIDRFEEEEFPLAVMYSLTYQGKRMLSDTKCLYQDFSMATLRFQIDLTTMDDTTPAVGGKCISCHTYSVHSTLGAEGEDSMLNICQLVWECWGENANAPPQYGMFLFDLDQWYKDQMPATCRLESSPFLSVTRVTELSAGTALDVRLDPASVVPYSHATRLEEHFYPNSLQYECTWLTTSEACVAGTCGVQRQVLSALQREGPAALLHPTRLYRACLAAGLTPLLAEGYGPNASPEEQRRYLLCVCAQARLARVLRRAAADWATHTHAPVGCTLQFLVDWCWTRAIDLKEYAKELTAPLFVSSALPDRNVVRCLEHCVQQLAQLTGLLDAVLTKCCNLVVPDALSEIEEKYKGIGTVSLYFQVVQWFLRVGLLPERCDAYVALPYPCAQLYTIYNKRRLKLQRLQENAPADDTVNKPCPLLYIDQLIENEFDGERIRQMWIKGGSESHGLYPPPSLYSLLRLYLLPDVAEEHKHSLVLYLLVDYSMVYDEIRYEEVIRRLMQFPTMFGLSNTAIKATQAFWHLDHRDFDFALDQLQCLTGNTLSEWQHNVVLSSLLAQKKTQAALQYLHVRKPAPSQTVREKDGDMSLNCSNRINDLDKLDDWQSCCNLYLARELVFEALDVVRMFVQNSGSQEEKKHALTFFFKGCRNTGQLSKMLHISLSPFEEEVFTKFIEDCNEQQTSDILLMYYLQQARYLEAEQYNNKMKQHKWISKEVARSAECMSEACEREASKELVVSAMCAALPPLATTVAREALADRDCHTHVVAPKPMSVYVKAKSPKNTFTYKSSFIQATIDNASETWVNKPWTRRGIKRALNIEETPFICTPKLSRNRSIFTDQPSEGTPPKRPRMDASTSRTPRSAVKVSAELSRQMAALLDMPDVHTPDSKLYCRSGAGTPHSILKTRREDADRDMPSPTESRYLPDSDDELETASNHTHYSDSKHLRFTIPTASESESTPSPPSAVQALNEHRDRAKESGISDPEGGKGLDIFRDDFTTTKTHTISESHEMESPPKKLATEDKVKSRKSYKDTVRARRSLSISANSSLSDDPNTSIESIADIPITLINPRYSGERRKTESMDTTEKGDAEGVRENEMDASVKVDVTVPKTPKGRRGIRAVSGESTPIRSRSVTPERQDSPMTLLRATRSTRSRSRTPERSPRSSSLAAIPELPAQEVTSEQHASKSLLSIPRQLRSRSRTPERSDKTAKESPRLEAITESPTKSSGSDSAASSPRRRSLRSRSRTPEVEIAPESAPSSPRSLRNRAKTPEKIMSPKMEHSVKSKKSLSRIVLEANAFAKTKPYLDPNEPEQPDKKSESVIECTPVKSLKQIPSLLDVTLSPIVNKSILQSSTESVLSESLGKSAKNEKSTALDLKSLPAFTTLHETYLEKSVLHSYKSSVTESSETAKEIKVVEVTHEDSSNVNIKSFPAFTTIPDIEFDKSVLHSYESSVGESSQSTTVDDKVEKATEKTSKPFSTFTSIIEADFNRPVLESNESSLAETSQETSMSNDSKNIPNPSEINKSQWKNMSSLMTSDSDVEMKDDKKATDKTEGQDTAAVIQKEKERIVEIEREINEIEGDMSDDDSANGGDEMDTSDEEIVEAEDSEEEEAESESSQEESEPSSDEEIISIKDTDTDESSSSTSYDKLQIDEETSTDVNKKGQEAQTRVHDEVKEITEEKNTNDKVEETVERSTDQLNQAQYSLLTDDNSIVESEHSDINLNYSDEKKNEFKEEVITHINVKNIEEEPKMNVEPDKARNEVPKESVADIPMETDAETPVTVEIVIEEVLTTTEPVAEEIEPIVQVIEPIESMETTEPIEEEFIIEESKPSDVVDNVKKTENKEIEKEVVDKSGSRTSKRTKSTSSNKSTKEENKITIEELEMVEKQKIIEETKTNDESKRIEESQTVEESKKIEEQNINKVQKTIKEHKIIKEQDTIEEHKTMEGAKPLDESKPMEESKTPSRRKRTQSTASNKSANEEQKTPETKETPSRRRAKTPSTEVRQIITRRASREMSEKMDESKESLDESLLVTPKRRSTRSRSKNIDDNESVASESSVRSTRSRASEDAGDVRAAPIRKGRKSILATKTDLSVIPETTAEESGIKTNSEIITDYSSSRRLTRHQKALLESWLEPGASPVATTPGSAAKTRGRRASAASEQSGRDDDDASSTHSGFDVRPIDRISLLSKKDFEGSPDREEYPNAGSPDSLVTDAGRERKPRLARAASESRALPKAAKISRRVSVDIAATPDRSTGDTDSPVRGRRASFNRACEALHTPKGRRTSTDTRRGEGESPLDSPAPSESEVTPARRTRRATSTQSNTSQAKSDTGKRSKKTSVVEESKDTKKK